MRISGRQEGRQGSRGHSQVMVNEGKRCGNHELRGRPALLDPLRNVHHCPLSPERSPGHHPSPEQGSSPHAPQGWVPAPQLRASPTVAGDWIPKRGLVEESSSPEQGEVPALSSWV